MHLTCLNPLQKFVFQHAQETAETREHFEVFSGFSSTHIGRCGFNLQGRQRIPEAHGRLVLRSKTTDVH